MYRADFAFSTFVRFLPIVTQILLWGAIYGIHEEGNSKRSLNGYFYHDMVAFYLLAMVGRAFSSMPGLAGGIAREVRDGTVKKYLTQPIDMLGYLFWARVAHKLVYYVVAIVPFGIVFYLCGDYFRFSPTWLHFLCFITVLIISFLLGFLIEVLIGLTAFWFLEVSSLIFIFMMVTYFLSGHMLPIDWLPAWSQPVVTLLPFKYLAHVPAAILLGKYTHQQMGFEILTGLLWVAFLYWMSRLMFNAGVRRYSAYGG